MTASAPEFTTLRTLPEDASVDEVCAALDASGAVILEHFVDDTMLAALWADLGPAFESQGWGEEGFIGNRTRRVCSLFAKTLHSAALVTEPRFYGAASYFLQRPVAGFLGDERYEVTPSMQIGVGHGVQIWPDETLQGLHRDDIVHLNTHPGRQTRVLAMVALTDFTAENGGTWVVPGSHLWDDERAPKSEEAVAAEMSAGSALLWLGSTYHCGGPNTSADPRTGLIYALDCANYRQEENQYLAVPIDIVRRYPEQVQRLLGYDVAAPFCGYVDMADPHVLLDGTGRQLGMAEQVPLSPAVGAAHTPAVSA
ncbi:phytanoyl-CoA dioxygenase family protein [Mycobacterium spongiae]|uniref:Phytanoyl-CoA dioxygenase family protein n=1 Tax=Mycobacterium spongiae TaxID=886343 RepID=A0A975JZ16_9MYCO|nr:phytanoyl-CoA dioxygenase family protein [Mycobacterium spongiae]QUR68331.1 phytanoyl-CoA dioxygenase family protein [Mycobacterium spongiae]